MACSLRSVRTSSRSPFPATKVTFCEFVSSRSRSVTKVWTLICSLLSLTMVPTTTTGCRLFELLNWLSHGYSNASLTMASATIRESVSFQRPLRSVTTPESTRVTFVSCPHPLPHITTRNNRVRRPKGQAVIPASPIMPLSFTDPSSLRLLGLTDSHAYLLPSPAAQMHGQHFSARNP